METRDAAGGRPDFAASDLALVALGLTLLIGLVLAAFRPRSDRASREAVAAENSESHRAALLGDPEFR